MILETGRRITVLGGVRAWLNNEYSGRLKQRLSSDKHLTVSRSGWMVVVNATGEKLADGTTMDQLRGWIDGRYNFATG